MKNFTPGKVIRRSVTIRSSDRALPNVEWVVSLSERGVAIRRASARKSDEHVLTWRSVIGHALIHSGKR